MCAFISFALAIPHLRLAFISVALSKTNTQKGKTVLYTCTARLFEYGESLLNQNMGIKTWNGRGKGKARLLRDPETYAITMVMSREGTHRVIANFVVSPTIDLTTKSDDRWCWYCSDYAYNSNLVTKTLGIKLKDQVWPRTSRRCSRSANMR